MARTSGNGAPSEKSQNETVDKKKVSVPKAKPADPKVQVKTVKAKTGAASSGSAAKVASKPQKVQVKPELKAKPVSELKEKIRKPKLVRDSFTMPETEYQVLGDIKKACLKAGVEVKKSELLRIGVALLKTMDPAKLKDAINALQPLKAGRPKKEK